MEKKYYQCKICLEEANEPIVTLCGHLYCWTCIYEWSKSKKNKIVPCPICCAEVDIDKVIPLYTDKEDHQKKTKDCPKRPKAEQKRYERADNRQRNDFNIFFNIMGFQMRLNNNNRGFGLLSIVPCLLFIGMPLIGNLFSWLLNILIFDNNNLESRKFDKNANYWLNNFNELEDQIFWMEEIIFEEILILFIIFVLFFIVLFFIIKKIINL